MSFVYEPKKRDKFVIGSPWRPNDIMAQYLEVFDDFYKRDRHLADKYANYTYSFPAFIELIRASECDHERMWRPVEQLCGPCSLEFDFLLMQENGLDEFDFVADFFTKNQTNQNRFHYRTKPRRKMEIMAMYRDVSYETLVMVYKKYFFDFVAFGYTPDEYFRFSRKFDDHSEELKYLRFVIEYWLKRVNLV